MLGFIRVVSARKAATASALLGVLTLLTLQAGPVQAQRPAPPTIDGAVQVTGDPAVTRSYAGPVLATHPQDPNIIVIADGEARASRCGLQVSTNRGLSWSARSTPEPSGTTCVWANNGPVLDVAFSADGAALYYAFSAGRPADWPQRTIYVARSTDLGESFELLTKVPTPPADLDKGQAGVHAMPSLGVDATRPNTVFVLWRSNYGAWNLGHLLTGNQPRLVQRPLMSVSNDGGRTFSEPVDAGGDYKGSIQSATLVVGQRGELMVFFGESAGFGGQQKLPGAHLHFTLSSDGGKTFSHQNIHQMPDGETTTVVNAPVAAIDRKSGTIHVVWEDMGGGPARVLTKRSEDGGKTWSAPVKVNDADPLRKWTFNESFPGLSIAPDGRIDVAWYDSREDPTARADAERHLPLQHVYYSHSLDGGQTWAPNVRVSDRLINRNIGVWETGIRSPVALVSDRHVANIAWVDARNGDPATDNEDIYFARARFVGPAEAFGGARSATTDRGWWFVLGLAVALVVAGGAFLAGTRIGNRPEPTPSAMSSRSTSDP